MTSDQIAATAGIVLSLIFSYVPGLSDWYDALTPTPKRLIMLVLLLLVAAGSLAYTCRADLAVCVGAEWEKYLAAFIAAAIANQAAYTLSPLSPARRTTRLRAQEKNMPVATPPAPAVENRTNQPLP